MVLSNYNFNLKKRKWRYIYYLSTIMPILRHKQNIGMASMRKIYQKILGMDYFCCSKAGHQNAPLNTLCADYSCNERCLLCAHCEQQNHINHDIVLLKDYLKKALLCTNIETEDENIAKLAGQIEKARAECIMSLQSYKSDISEQIDSLIYEVSIQYDRAAQKVKEIVTLNQQIKSFIKLYDSVHSKYFSVYIDEKSGNQQQFARRYEIDLKNINGKLQNLLKYTSVESVQFENQLQNCDRCEQNFTISSLSPQIKILSEAYSKKCKIVSSDFSKISTEVHSTYSKVIEKLQQEVKTTSSFKKSSFGWSQNLKAGAMFLNGNIIQRKTGSNIERFALFQQDLLPYIQKKKTAAWAIKIIKLTGWIGIGVCLKEKIVSSGFKFNYESLGHGSYMISSNGYTWSSSVQTSNSAYHPFSFGTNDFVIVQFEGDPQWRLNFYVCKEQMLVEKATSIKDQGSQLSIPTSELPSLKNSPIPFIKVNLNDLKKTHVLQIQKNTDYTPCVNLCSVGDSVSIAS